MQHTHQVWDEARARALIDGLKHLPGATLPILHALQDEFGYVDQLAIPLIADALALSRAEVVGVINFYHDFRQSPPGHHIMRVCRAESCQAMGCESLVSHIEGQLGVRVGDTTPDGAITLQAVYCLGNCALSPAVLMDRDLHGRVSNQRADDLIVAARGG
jgi:formate dehydrogenase subunit gamma